ncbi:MAG: pyridoxal-phosphate dependent enzyme, partial [Candidatus Izemoplasmatales bacterium]|nr:pyridoxal-phosphate dependent enzyme [Candidatus Izemoplasmatales bacterium]
GLKGQHKIQGIGAGMIPDTLDGQIYDEIITITNEEAFEHARLLARIEGILAGISAGAALSGAVKVSSRPSSKPRNIVFVVPDGAERYLSADIY